MVSLTFLITTHCLTICRVLAPFSFQEYPKKWSAYVLLNQPVKSEEEDMCDYSVQAGKQQREAVRGNPLITKKISDHTIGFVDVNDQTTAVCLIPGTALAFDEPVKFASGGGSIKSIPFAGAKFCQIEKGNALTHHDALAFPDGQTVKLTLLLEGQTAMVMELPAAPKTPAQVEQQRRVEYV